MLPTPGVPGWVAVANGVCNCVTIGVGGSIPGGTPCCPCDPDMLVLVLFYTELQLYSDDDVFHGPVSVIRFVSLVP